MPAKRTDIVLTTIGRLTGEPRRARLYAWPDGDRLVVVGSRGGAARHPAWALNLRAKPVATVVVGKDEWNATAREVADGAERDRLWRLVVEAFPLYAAYQKRTKRRIPLFVLERTG
jgi:deazaflavin-dependent oxidoreductase (nitroreductase family)